jgi:hypothetical protein
MEMEKRMLQMLELPLARQEEAAARQEKAEADAKARHKETAARQEKATAELKAAILVSFRGSMTCQRRRRAQKEWRLRIWKLLQKQQTLQRNGRNSARTR